MSVRKQVDGQFLKESEWLVAEKERLVLLTVVNDHASRKVEVQLSGFVFV